MSSEMVIRWPVRISSPLNEMDFDREGGLTDAAVQRLFGIARTAYFERCNSVDWATSEVEWSSILQRRAGVAGRTATVAVAVIEVFPDRFTMATRVRADVSDGIVAEARCSVLLGGGVTDSIRDEFIALAHAAQYVH